MEAGSTLYAVRRSPARPAAKVFPAICRVKRNKDRTPGTRWSAGGPDGNPGGHQRPSGRVPL